MSAEQNSRFLNAFYGYASEIRAWESKVLPLAHSRIATDLFLLIAKSHLEKRRLTIKDIFNSLKYSERGIRNILEQFVSDGWCEIVDHAIDKRFRLVVPSGKGVEVIELYAQTAQRYWSDHFAEKLPESQKKSASHHPRANNGSAA